MINKSKTFSRATMAHFLHTDLVKIIMTSTDLDRTQADSLASEVVTKCQ